MGSELLNDLILIWTNIDDVSVAPADTKPFGIADFQNCPSHALRHGDIRGTVRWSNPKRDILHCSDFRTNAGSQF